jgi:hypothetical protein
MAGCLTGFRHARKLEGLSHHIESFYLYDIGTVHTMREYCANVSTDNPICALATPRFDSHEKGTVMSKKFSVVPLNAMIRHSLVRSFPTTRKSHSQS